MAQRNNPAHPGTISRTLVTAGFPLSEQVKTEVPGFTVATRGITSARDLAYTSRRVQVGTLPSGTPRTEVRREGAFTGFVRVDYLHGWKGGDLTQEGRNAEAVEVLSRAAVVLREHGYVVRCEALGAVGLPVLHVCRVDGTGNIIA